MLEFAFSMLLLTATGVGAYFLIRLFNPLCLAKEYVNLYKVARIKQYAKSKDLDLDDLLLSLNKRYEVNRKDFLTPNQKIEEEIFDELGEKNPEIKTKNK